MHIIIVHIPGRQRGGEGLYCCVKGYGFVSRVGLKLFQIETGFQGQETGRFHTRRRTNRLDRQIVSDGRIF